MITTMAMDMGVPRAHATINVGNSAGNVLASAMDANDDYARVIVTANDIYFRLDGSAVSVASAVGMFADISTGVGCELFLNRHEIYNFNAANAVASSVGTLQVTFYRR